MFTVLRNVAIAVSIVLLILSIVFLGLAETGFITSAIKDELQFRELSQPRIDFIKSETLDCIQLEVRDDESLTQDWLEVDSEEWVLWALLREEDFPMAVSSVHNSDYSRLMLTVANCPYEERMRTEFNYWFKRVYNTPTTDWFEYYNPLIIN